MSIYQHFRPEEKEFIDHVLNWVQFVEENYASKLTDFLDPREQYITKSVIGSERDIKVAFFGGTDNCERKRALIYPEYIIPEENDFQITLFEIIYPDKFVTLTHPQVLGSTMGIGLRRGKFGDILISDKRIQFFAAEEVGEYIRLHFHSVGKTEIMLEEKNYEEAIQVSEDYSESQTTVSSMRLDAVLSSMTNLSRQKALDLIKQGHVKVNWKTVEEPSFIVHEGDVLSAKRFGRMKILEIGDKTKKEKWRITVGKLK